MLNLYEYFNRGWVGKPRDVNIPKTYFNATVPELSKCLEKAVLDSVPDCNLGLLLSGGLDSSLIAGVLANHEVPFSSYCAGSYDPEIDDGAWVLSDWSKANVIREDVATLHETTKLLSSTFQDGPIQFNSAPALYHVCKEVAKDGIKVLISGEGGDELFWGYPRYLNAIINFWDLLKDGYSIPEIVWYGSGRRNAPFAEALAGNRDRGESYQWLVKYQHIGLPYLLPLFDQVWRLPQLITIRNQRIGDLFGIRFVYPFLSDEFTNYANAIKWKWKYRDGVQRWIQKEMAAKYLSYDLLSRPKQPFDSELSSWFRTDECRDALKSMNLGGVNPEIVSLIMREHFNKANDYGALIQKLYYLGVWMDTRSPPAPNLKGESWSK